MAYFITQTNHCEHSIAWGLCAFSTESDAYPDDYAASNAAYKKNTLERIEKAKRIAAVVDTLFVLTALTVAILGTLSLIRISLATRIGLFTAAGAVATIDISTKIHNVCKARRHDAEMKRGI